MLCSEEKCIYFSLILVLPKDIAWSFLLFFPCITFLFETWANKLYRYFPGQRLRSTVFSLLKLKCDSLNCNNHLNKVTNQKLVITLLKSPPNSDMNLNVFIEASTQEWLNDEHLHFAEHVSQKLYLKWSKLLTRSSDI